MEAPGSRGARGPSARDSDERDDCSHDGGARCVCRGQDVGDGVWPVVAALLPRAAQLQVRARLAVAARFPCVAAPRGSRDPRRRAPRRTGGR